MRKVLRSKIFIVLLTLVVFSALVAQTVKHPDFVAVDRFNLNTIHNGVCSADVVFLVHNDNWFSLKGRDLNSEIYYGDRLVAIGNLDDQFELSKKATNQITMNLVFFLDSLKSELKDFLMKDSIEFSVKISGKFTFLNIQRTMDMKLSISSAEMVDNLVADIMDKDGLQTEIIELKEIGITNTFFDIGFRVKNKLSFDFIVKEIRSSVYADVAKKQKVADWVISSDKLVRKDDSELILGEAKIDNIQSAISGFLKVISGSLDYYIQGYALLEVDAREIKLPLNQHFRVSPTERKVEIID